MVQVLKNTTRFCVLQIYFLIFWRSHEHVASCSVLNRYPILSHRPVTQSDSLEAHCVNQELIYEPHWISGDLSTT